MTTTDETRPWEKPGDLDPQLPIHCEGTFDIYLVGLIHEHIWYALMADECPVCGKRHRFDMTLPESVWRNGRTYWDHPNVSPLSQMNVRVEGYASFDRFGKPVFPSSAPPTAQGEQRNGNHGK